MRRVACLRAHVHTHPRVASCYVATFVRAPSDMHKSDVWGCKLGKPLECRDFAIRLDIDGQLWEDAWQSVADAPRHVGKEPHHV